MNIKRGLWGLWGALILSMLLRQTIDTYMVVALIIIPVLLVLLDLHDKIDALKEENKHQRKFVLDRYNLLQERVNDAFNQIEKRMVADFSEMSKSNERVNYDPTSSTGSSSGYVPPERRKPRKLKKRSRTKFNQNNPFQEEGKSDDERFAEEKFGNVDLQRSFDEQVLEQVSTDFEDDLERVS